MRGIAALLLLALPPSDLIADTMLAAVCPQEPDASGACGAPHTLQRVRHDSIVLRDGPQGWVRFAGLPGTSRLLLCPEDRPIGTATGDCPARRWGKAHEAARAHDDTAVLTWPAPTTYTDGAALPAEKIQGYKILRAKGRAGVLTELATVGSVLTYTDRGLASGEWCYVLRTVSVDGPISDNSAMACKTIAPPPPKTPSPPPKVDSQ